ncbi:MAG: heavy-metal-associated domain-containing protein [Calditrichaeota bacterium]|nr:MAG: heavy-metal-associated domain-containing protein [Calditrichota bacterium]
MNSKTLFIALALITLPALISCTTEARQETADATPTALVTIDVQGMTCAGCETSIKMAVKKIAGVKNVEASFSEGTAVVTVNPEKAQEQQIIDAINKIGYTAKKKKS